jgi:hypothetical protein
LPLNPLRRIHYNSFPHHSQGIPWEENQEDHLYIFDDGADGRISLMGKIRIPLGNKVPSLGNWKHHNRSACSREDQGPFFLLSILVIRYASTFSWQIIPCQVVPHFFTSPAGDGKWAACNENLGACTPQLSPTTM